MVSAFVSGENDTCSLSRKFGNGIYIGVSIVGGLYLGNMVALDMGTFVKWFFLGRGDAHISIETATLKTGVFSNYDLRI